MLTGSHASVHVKYLLSFSDFDQNLKGQTNVSKSSHLLSFTKIRTRVLELLHADKRTDMWQITCTYFSIAKASQISVQDLNLIDSNMARKRICIKMRTTRKSFWRNNHLSTAHKGERRRVYIFCVRKPERPLRKRRRKRRITLTL